MGPDEISHRAIGTFTESNMKYFPHEHSSQANSFLATAFGIVMTVLLFSGYELVHAVAVRDMVAVHADAVVRVDAIVVTARRG